MKAKLHFLTITITLFFSQPICYSQSLQFVNTFNGKRYEFPGDMVISKKGNIFVSGFYNSDTLSIGNCTLYNLSNKKNNTFLAKMDTLGNCFWIKTIAVDSLNNSPANLAVDSLDNIYITNQFHGQIDVDPSANSYYLNTLPSCTNIFVAKYDNNGSFKWAFPILDSFTYTRDAYIEIDKEQNLLLSGSYYKTTDFDPSANTYTLCPIKKTSPAGFLAKYDTNGTLIWVNSLAGKNGGGAEILDIEVDNCNNILITGNCGDTIDFNPGIGVYNLNSPFGSDYFLAKYSPNNNLLWAFVISGNYNEWGTNIRIGSNNNIYVAGTFRTANIDFDPSPTNTTILSTHGQSDIFLAKYDSLGNMIFTKSIGGLDNEYIYDLDIDLHENLYWVINYWSNGWDCDFSTNSQVISQQGGGDDLILQTDSAGSLNNFFRIGTIYTDSYCRRINQINNSFFVLGWYNGLPVDFDPTTNYSCPLYYGQSDITLAKYGLNTVVVTNQHDFTELKNIEIYPNPANHFINIKGIDEHYTIRIYDILGKILIEKAVDTNTIIDLEKLSQGLYSLVILKDNLIKTTTKVIILTDNK